MAAESCNSETASSDQVMKRQCGERQASLKPALVCFYSPFQAADPEHPIMLHNHTSVQVSDNKILILGGGGNCFSFGTHLNNSPIELTLDMER